MTAPAAGIAAAPLNPLALPAISASYFALGVNMLAPIGLVAEMAGDLGVSTGAVAYLLSASALAYAVTAPILQMLIGAWDRRGLIIIGLALAAAGSLLCAAAPVFAAALVGRAIMGAGFALIGPMATAMAASIVAPQRSGQAIGVALMGMSIASVVGVPLVTFAGAQAGWRLAMTGAAALCFAVIAMLRWSAPSGSRGARATPLAMLAALKDPVLAPALLSPFFQFAAQYATHAMIAVFLMERFHAPAALIPMALMTIGVSGVLGSTLIAWLQGRARADVLITLALGALGLVFVALLFAPAAPWLTFVLLVCWGAAGATALPPMSGRLVALAGESRNMVLALNSALLQCGIAAGAAIAGLAYDAFGARMLPLASLALLILSALAYGISRHCEKRRAAAPPPAAA